MSHEQAIAAARSGQLLGPAEMMAIFAIAPSTFYKHAKRGLYDLFKVHPPLGPKCYSGVLVARWLDGDELRARSFGRRTPSRPPSRHLHATR